MLRLVLAFSLASMAAASASPYETPLTYMTHSEGFSAMPHIYKMLSPFRLRQNQQVKGPASLLSAEDYSTGPKDTGNRRSRKKRSIHSGFYQKSRYGYRPLYGLGPFRRFNFGRRGYRNKVFVHHPGGIFFHH